MELVFCTLFDSNYLDKGIALYRSLSKVCNKFKLYVLAMDVRCDIILHDTNADNMVVISLNDFVNKMDLVEIQKDRSRAEFCWTCTSYLIDYVLSYCNENICTYLDSDLYFYQNPEMLINEMQDKSVQIVKHGFGNSYEDRQDRKRAGTYCVEFNTFKKSKESLELLRWWEKKCKECCNNNGSNDAVFGDQKYLENWGEYNFVSVLEHQGGGVAPWNVNRFRIDSSFKDQIVLKNRYTKEKFELIFYHFHGITYNTIDCININVYTRKWIIDKQLVRKIYFPYLLELDAIKKEISRRYDFLPLLTAHPGLAKEKKSFVEKIKNFTKGNSVSEIILKAFGLINIKFKHVFLSRKNIILLPQTEK